MIHRTYLLTCLAASVLLAGCSGGEFSENVLPVDPADAHMPLNVGSTSLDASVETAPVSRAATTEITTNGTIGIFRDATNGYTAANNIRYNYGSPKWAPNTVSETIYLGLLSTNICAYHPYVSGNSTSTAIPLTTAEAKADGSNDLSYATNQSVEGRTNKTTALNFAMKRAYAKLGFKFKRNNYTGTCTVSNLTVTNILPSTTLDITRGTYYATVGTTDEALNVTKSVTVTTVAGATTDWTDTYLLVPCTPSGTGMTIALTVDGKLMTTTVLTTTYQPVAGEYKTITLTLNGTAVNVGKVTTTDWPVAVNEDVNSKFD